MSIFPNSRIVNVFKYTEAGPGEPGTVMTVDYELDGQPYTGINGGPMFTFDEAMSLLINCADQAEVDYYWDKLTEGGEESQCGWLKDKFGALLAGQSAGDGGAVQRSGPGTRSSSHSGDAGHEEARPRRDAGGRGLDRLTRAPFEPVEPRRIGWRPTDASRLYRAGMQPAAVLWDMDGTLVDTEPYWIACEHELVAEFDGTWSAADAHSIVGFDLLDAAVILRDRGGVRLDPHVIVERLLDGVIARAARELPWRPGAAELLAECQAAGVPCALVTMSWRRLADAVLAAAPAGSFAASITGDEVVNGKPDPEPYVAAAAALGVGSGGVRRHRGLADRGCLRPRRGVCDAGSPPCRPPHSRPRLTIVGSLADVALSDLGAPPPRLTRPSSARRSRPPGRHGVGSGRHDRLDRWHRQAGPIRKVASATRPRGARPARHRCRHRRGVDRHPRAPTAAAEAGHPARRVGAVLDPRRVAPRSRSSTRFAARRVAVLVQRHRCHRHRRRPERRPGADRGVPRQGALSTANVVPSIVDAMPAGRHGGGARGPGRRGPSTSTRSPRSPPMAAMTGSTSTTSSSPSPTAARRGRRPDRTGSRSSPSSAPGSTPTVER